MDSNDGNVNTQKAVATFRNAAVQFHLGHYLDLESMQDEARTVLKKAVAALESLNEGARTALIPLLSDKDDGVRVAAAAYLLDSMPDIALPVLHDMRENGNLEASLDAHIVLLRYI